MKPLNITPGVERFPLTTNQSLYVFIDTYKLDRHKTQESISRSRFVSRQKGKELSVHKKECTGSKKTKQRKGQ